jgi:hypothetical protein
MCNVHVAPRLHAAPRTMLVLLEFFWLRGTARFMRGARKLNSTPPL